MSNKKEYSEWMSKQGFDALRHANCCKIAFNGGWESRQREVDELKASHHGEIIGHTHHLSKVKKECDELQKRVDALIKHLDEMGVKSWAVWESSAEMYEQGRADAYWVAKDLLEQALKGGEA